MASAHDIEVQNDDGVTIYYNYISDGTELEVTFRGTSYDSYSNEYTGNVVIPEEVTYMNSTYKVTGIGNNAFIDCSGLTSVTISNGVTSIGEAAFRWCSGLTSVTIPNSVTSIGSFAFSGCSSLTSISIPNSVTSIGRYAFSACSSLTSITLPNSVTSISDNTFYRCTNLAFISIPNSVTSIGSCAFFGCTSLTSIHISDLEAWCKIYFQVSGPTPPFCAHHLYLNGEEIKNLVIPNSVKCIGYGAFEKTAIESIVIPGSVTNIKNSSAGGGGGNIIFSGCSNLNSIIVENWNPVYDSRENCNAIIGSSSKILISGCKNTTIPNSVKAIGPGAFYGCSELTSITIPNSVTSIGQSALYGCTGLTSISIPNSVTSIGDAAFETCTSLASITIPQSVMSIGKNTFSGCTSLASIIIPECVTSISEMAFKNCNGLQHIYCYAEQLPTTRNDVFADSNVASATLHVPSGSIDAYKTIAPWNGFGSIVALTDSDPKPSGIEMVHGSGAKFDGYFDLNGRMLKGEPTQKGVYIYEGKKIIVK